MKENVKPSPKVAEDAGSVGSDISFYTASAFSQWSHLFLLVLKLKTWWFLLLPLPATLLLSNLFLTQLLKPSNPRVKEGLKLYTMSDFTAEGNRVLVDRSSFKSEVSALERIATRRGGTPGWLLDCSPESKCRAEFIGERERVAAYIRFSEKPSTKRSVAECFWKKDSSLRCAFVYHLMVLAMFSKQNRPNSEFLDMQLFTLESSGQASDENKPNDVSNLSLANSVCADWIKKGIHVFDANLEMHIEVSLSLATIGVALYFLISTAFRIRSIKTNGFLKYLVRNGLSVTSYWTVIWLITLIECLAFSGLFVMSYVLYCPGVYPAKNVFFVFLIFNWYCLLLAGIAFLLELLVPNFFAAAMIMVLVSLSLVLSFSNYSRMQETASFIPFLFPPMHTNNYIVTHMRADIRYQLTGADPVSDKSMFHLAVVLSIAGTTVLFILLDTYLDFLLRSGNGFHLPWYYPLSCRFWYPDKANDDDRVHLASKAVTDPSIEPVTGLSASIIADRISKSFNVCGCCSPGPGVLHRISCIVFRDQVTALVGHSGAGKTTLMKILTGDEEPSFGAAYVAGFKVTDPLERLAVRGVFSVCPQIDSLCSSLTSMECIETVLVSKGANFPSELDRARLMLEQLGARGIETAKTSELSAGQRRKLSTVIALLADPEVVFLDEPTCGLDPLSALQLWGLLQEEKYGRSIVVCTKYMHEADILADRKIVLCDGDILCAGSSRFLQRSFGCKATLNVTLKFEWDADVLLQKMGQMRLKSKSNNEIQLEMVDTGSSNELVDAAKVLNDNKDIVTSFFVSQTTISDVFARLEGMRMSEVSEHLRSGNLSEFLEKEIVNAEGSKPDLSQPQQLSNSGPSSFMRFAAMFVINLKRQVRILWQTVRRIILPLIFIILLGAWVPVLRHLYNSGKGTDRVLDISETDSFNNFFFVKSQMHSSTMNLKAVCMHDSEVVMNLDTKFCTELLFSTKAIEQPPKTIEKPKSQTMKQFLLQPSTIRQLREGCNGMDDKLLPCIVYYSTPSWDPSYPNIQRSVTIGIFIGAEKSDVDTAHLLRRAFLQISRLFGAGEPRNGTALSHIRPFSQYGYFCLEMLLLFAVFNLFPISFISDCVEDSTSNVRFQLASAGMSRMAYWFYTFLVHWIQYILCFSISASLLLIWDRYRDLYFLLQICLPVFLLGTISNQLVAYILAATSKPSRNVVSVCYQIFTLLLPTVLIVMHLQGVALVAPLIFLPSVATFALGYFGMLQATYKLEYYHTNRISDIPDVFHDCWNSNMLYMLSIIAMTAHIVIFFWTMLLIEKWDVVRGKCTGSGDCHDYRPEVPRNPNVVNEETHILESLHNPQNVLEIVKLRKTYPNGVEAVKGVTFGAMAGEILGLLGSSGAGKTTVLSVAGGKEKLTEGSCQVRARNANWSLNLRGPTVGAVGYCPQYSPLYDCITVSEHLMMYAHILGVPRGIARKQVVSLLSNLGLAKRQHVRAEQLSIGEKRRLCLAIALLGDPALIVIDQATNGVDLKTRRFIWNAVRTLRHQSRSVLIATHRLEEADALCDRVGVMNQGRLISFSTANMLRSLRSDACILEVRMELVDAKRLLLNKSNLKGSLAVMLDSTSVLSDWGTCVQFGVPRSAMDSFPIVLEWLAINAKLLGLRSYLLRQMSFEEALVYLVRRHDGNAPP